MRYLFNVLLALVCIISLTGCEPAGQTEKTGMRDFTLNDIDGKAISLSDYRGKVVLLEFWGTWCPPCRQSVPELQQLHERMEGEDFKIIAIAINDKLNKVRKFAEENKVTYTIVLDDKDVDDVYRVHTIPTTMLLDKEGNIALTHRGYAPGMFDQLEKDIRELIK